MTTTVHALRDEKWPPYSHCGLRLRASDHEWTKEIPRVTCRTCKRRVAISRPTPVRRISNRDENHCYINDQLNGQELKAGERLRVRWPDGTRETVTVTLEGIESTNQEMNGCYETHTDYHTVYRTTYHGVKVLVPLLGLLAQRIAKAATPQVPYNIGAAMTISELLAADPQAQLVAPVTLQVKLRGRRETVRLAEHDCVALLQQARRGRVAKKA
jgi:hypothetical protein